MNGKPEPLNITHNSFEVRWNRPTFAFPSHYLVHVREASDPEGWSFTTTGRECSTTINDLSLNTKYIVSVCACAGRETGPFGYESDEISTKNLAFKIKSQSTLLRLTPDMQNYLPMYAVKSDEERNDTMKTRRIIIGEVSEDGPDRNGKCLLIFSTPHSGKITLLQGIMNYVFGVSSDDNFRLCFEPELTRKSDMYQDWVTLYDFKEYEGGRLGYPLTIIDVPRYHGSKKEYFEKIHETLNFIIRRYQTEIGCISFVTQANAFTLPSDQIEYIRFMKYLFKIDLNEDMCCLFTFADLGPAHVQRILEDHEIALSESFSFNWSNLFQIIEPTSNLIWRTNFDGLNRCFNRLQELDLIPLRKSLTADPPIPEKREELKSNIASLQPEVSADLAKLGEITLQVEKFTVHKKDILSSGDFSFTIEEIKQKKEPLEKGKHVTNCLTCYFTCHKNCSIPDDDGKIGCSAMHNGYCTVCKGHCIWSDHKNTPYIYSYSSDEVTKSYKEMKSDYEKKMGKPMDFNDYLEYLNKEIEALLERLQKNVEIITTCDNELKGIERSPLSGTVNDTIDRMIDAENLRQDKGFEQRIKMFLELKKYNKMIIVRSREED